MATKKSKSKRKQFSATDACKVALHIERLITKIAFAAKQTVSIQQNCSSSELQMPSSDAAQAFQLPADTASRCIESLSYGLEELNQLLQNPSVAAALKAVHENLPVPVGDDSWLSYSHAAFAIGQWLYGLFLRETSSPHVFDKWLNSGPDDKQFAEIGAKDFDAIFIRISPEIVRRMSDEKTTSGLNDRIRDEQLKIQKVQAGKPPEVDIEIADPELSLSENDLAVLAVLSKFSQKILNQDRIGVEAVLSRNTVSNVLKKLIAGGYVRHPVGKKRGVTITDRGREAAIALKLKAGAPS